MEGIREQAHGTEEAKSKQEDRRHGLDEGGRGRVPPLELGQLSSKLSKHGRAREHDERLLAMFTGR